MLSTPSQPLARPSCSSCCVTCRRCQTPSTPHRCLPWCRRMYDRSVVPVDTHMVGHTRRVTPPPTKVGQLAALLVAVPSGRLSDRLGRKPLVYASCLVMAIVYIGFASAPSIQMARQISPLPPPTHTHTHTALILGQTPAHVRCLYLQPTSLRLRRAALPLPRRRVVPHVLCACAHVHMHVCRRC